MDDAVDPAGKPRRGEGPSAEEVTERLRRQIQDGVWGPGEWLREARLCAEFDVGRTIVRRALRNLADDGLVDLQANRGASVKHTSLQEVFDLFELRAGLYGVAARFACIRATPPALAEILEKADRLIAASEAGAAAEDLIAQSEVIFSLMAETASVETRTMIAAVRRKTRWHYSYAGLAEGPGPFGHWRLMRAALAARDPAGAAEGARDILYYMQNEVARVMLARGLGVQQSAKDRPGRRGGGGRRTG
ncbi:GntR family transcriptional regulator [Azospirillum sp. B4]|uniref:GntR family transcriptional regulator n=1 Tax=Azospirillum sp. B4 TaxID=95605 RepID=UPI0006786780|nr:GntR family transcriptional regulator [Azospirillum sp. B4]